MLGSDMALLATGLMRYASPGWLVVVGYEAYWAVGMPAAE